MHEERRGVGEEREPRIPSSDHSNDISQRVYIPYASAQLGKSELQQPLKTSSDTVAQVAPQLPGGRWVLGWDRSLARKQILTPLEGFWTRGAPPGQLFGAFNSTV